MKRPIWRLHLNVKDHQNLEQIQEYHGQQGLPGVAQDGTVIYDSSGKEKSMGNHKNRTEIKEAL